MKKLTPNLMVENVNKTVEFYKDILGFETVMTVPEEGVFNWAMMKNGNVEIMFQTKENLVKEIPDLEAKEEKYAKNIMKTRLNRLDEKDRSKAQALMENLKDSAIEDKNTIMTELGKLISKADSYYSLPPDSELLEYQYHIYQNVWPEADELRRRGKLLKLGEKIQCPVIAIHGDYDPHPSEGVKNPLSQTIKDFRFILLKNCGHKPWIERSAKDRFYEILKEELSYSNSKLPDIA